MSEDELRRSIKALRTGRRKILINWLGLAAIKWIGGLLIFLAFWLITIGPMFVIVTFASWLQPESHELFLLSGVGSIPFMAFAAWLFGTHPQFNDFWYEWKTQDRQWKIDLDNFASALDALKDRLKEVVRTSSGGK